MLEANGGIGDHFAALFACITDCVAALMQRDVAVGLHWAGQAMAHLRAPGVRNVGETSNSSATTKPGCTA